MGSTNGAATPGAAELADWCEGACEAGCMVLIPDGWNEGDPSQS